ncbi:endo-1,4-beta-xylanase [Methylobacterium sp. J-076]|uniref:endo-1,4-beta-xylanase n=1 Tax=Methylobacterium sp. J-076 TaxID=2836655 RepID=UPI001FBB315C|nr:endo-1,4-beta-xylanase [Methylobacterium sp. J-076]MCJ2011971.1 endo-1,4-beta-xylanase [Methylobacterium sp. J-076]
MSISLNRRSLLTGAAASGLAAPAVAAADFGPVGRPSWAADGPQGAAARKGLAFGAAVPSNLLNRSPDFRTILARDCGLLLGNNEMKMAVVLPEPGRTDFAPADSVVRFARAHGQHLRGHALVWHEALPAWVAPRLAGADARQAEDLLRRWIDTVAGRYRGMIESWDVVNEILAGYGPVRRPDGLRETPWLAALGPGYVDLAFHLAREADPRAALAWNEDSLEHDFDWVEARRSRALKRLEGMRARGVPIRRFGIQAHLVGDHPFDATKFRRFLRELGQLGLGIEITELDIDDKAFPADIAARDRAVADVVRRILDVALDEPALLNVVTWGLFDGDTWLNDHPDHRRRDGLRQRPLPLDEGMRPKPFRDALIAAFRAAPDHSAARARLRNTT